MKKHKKNYKLTSQSEFLANGDEESMSVMAKNFMDDMQPDRIPRGIEVEENRLYFYCPIGDKEALELNRLLR